MKKITWEEILSQKPDKINIIWYGSLLNSNTHHENHACIPVIVPWIRRLYEVQNLPEGLPKEFYNLFFKNHVKNFWVKNREEFDKNIWSKRCGLNCKIWGKSDYINGLLFEILWDDIQDYATREQQYNLIDVEYCDFFDSEIRWQAYILTAHRDILDDGTPFMEYHNNTRKWAYNISEEFWKMFDKTTYDVYWNLLANKR